MCVLSVLFTFEHTRRRRKIFFSEKAFNTFRRRISCFIGNSQAVRSHISYKTNSADSFYFNTLIKLLSSLHSSFCLKSQPSWRFLLKSRCNKRRRRLFSCNTLLYLSNYILSIIKPCQYSVRLFLAAYFSLFSIYMWKLRLKYFAAWGSSKLCVYTPVFLRNKFFNFRFTINYQTNRNRLNTSCWKPSFNLFP